MLILALDTTMAACSVAVVDTQSTDPLASEWQAMERGHAEAIAPMVARVMDAAGATFSAVGMIAVTAGPGTFTGVRIGLAMARGLGMALAKPVAGVDTLSAIAANAPGGAPLLVVAEARNAEVYTALFDKDRRNDPAPAIVACNNAARHCPPGTWVIGTAADAVIAASGRSDLRRGTWGDVPVAALFAPATFAIMPAALPSPIYLRDPDARPQAMRPPPISGTR